MKRFQSIIQKYITNHQKHKKYLAAVLALSVLVSFAVPISLIMPAVSMTERDTDKIYAQPLNNGIMTLSAESEYPNAVDIATADELFALTVMAGDKTVYYINKTNDKTETGDSNLGEVTNDLLRMEFSLSYRFSDIKNEFSNGNKYMVIDTVLNPHLSFSQVGNGIVSAGDEPAGSYEIKNGYILITLYDDYIDKIKSGTGMVEGTLNFSGELSRDENGSGEQKFTVAGEEISVKFSSRHPEVSSKSGDLTNPADGTITWQVQIHNTYKADLSSYVLTDKMLEDATKVTFSPDGVGNHADKSNRITFNSNTANQEWITITYKTPIGNHTQGDTITNTAKLTKTGDDNYESQKDDSVYLNKKPVEVSKSGTPDYNNGKIKWTITVTSNYGESLEGYQVVDSAFKNNNTIKVNGNNNVSVSGDTLTLSSINGNTATIEYETTATEGNNSNSVYIKKDTVEKDKKENVNVEYKKRSDLVGLNKWGEYKPDTHEVEWTITITPENNYYLNDYELTDSQFPSSIDNLEFNPSDVKGKVSLSNGKLTFNNNGNVSGNVTITYRTPVTLPEGTQTTAVSNDIDDNHRTSTVTAVVTNITTRKSVSKVATGDKWQSVSSSGEVTREIGWKASITSDGKFAGKTYTDTLTVEGDGATHTINKDSANFILKAKSTQSDSETTLTKDTDYTINIADDGKSFTITFKNEFDSSNNYNYVDITYNTTAKLGSGYAEYKFKNGAGFDGAHANPGPDSTYSITRNNPISVQTMKLQVDKNWENADSSDKIPVTFKLQYRKSTETDNDWKDVHGSDENYLFDTDSSYSSSSIYTIELTANSDYNNDFKTQLRELPMKRTETHEDNSQTVIDYYYRVLEKNPFSNEYFESNGYFEKDGKIYSVEYGNNVCNNSNNNSVSVKNKVYKNININPSKKWTDSSDNEITDNNKIPVQSVTIELQKRIKYSGDTWEKVVESVLTKESNWQFPNADDYKNLTSAEVKDGKLVEYEYRVVETEYDGKAIGSINSVEGGYFEVTNNNITVTSDSSPEITNKLSVTKNQKFSVKKIWEEAYGVNYSEYRPSSITFELQRQTDNSGPWETIETYTMNLPYNDSLHEFLADCPNQVIADNGTITKYNYQVVETGYTYNNETVKLSSGTKNFVTGGNGYWTIENPENSNGEVTIKNRFVPYEEISVKPQKKWVGDEEFTDNRKPVTLRLQQKLQSSNEWADYKDSDKQFVEVTLNSNQSTDTTETDYDNGTPIQITVWNGDEVSGLPKSGLVKSEVTENGETKVKYETVYYDYRFVELGDDGEPLADGASFKVSDGKYEVKYEGNTVTNIFKESVGIAKGILDKNGDLTTSIDISDLENWAKITIDNEEYYVFNWLIEFEAGSADTINDNNKDILSPVIDILPDGFTLCEDSTKTENTSVNPTVNGSTVSDAIKQLHSALGDYYPAPIFTWTNNFALFMGKKSTEAELWETALKDNYYYYEEHYQGNTVEVDILNQWSHQVEKHLSYKYNDNDNEHLKGHNVVIFNRPVTNNNAKFPFISYSTKIKVTDLQEKLRKGTYTITNHAERYTIDDDTITRTHAEDSASLTIVNNIPTGLIAKNGTALEINKNTGAWIKSSPGEYNFSIEVNPDGKNLSNGDTIDIEDLFETTGYLDQHESGWTDGKKLVDILMKNIVVSEVDANGNKTALKKSDYVLEFDNSSSVTNGAALMKLTVPDEKHLVIDYTYKMIANANTPSVIKGCRSDVLQKGKYLPMEPGFVPPSGDKIRFKNTASLKADSASDTAKFEEKEYQFFKSSGTINTTRLPKIIKVNTGNTSIKDLQANFLLAQYNQSTGKWKYATKIEQPNNGSSREAKITEWSGEYSGSQVPADAAMINVQTAYQIEVNLSQNALYKLIEVNVPDGYEGSQLNLDDEFKTLIVNYLNNKTTSLNNVDYDTFLKHYVHTHYFVYNSVLSSYPDGVKAENVIQVKQGEDVEIPNNQLINIGVGKEWSDGEHSDDSITVQLYWSHTKNTSGIPDDAKPATAADLGIMDAEFTAKKTLKMSDFNAEKISERVWTDLPNGKDDKPVYYYIKETAYTIDGVTYTLDENDGVYKHNEDEGVYYPIYVGNAANVASSGSDTPSAVIKIKNTKSLVLKKVWKDSSGNPLTKGVPDSINVSIYGTDKDTNEEILLFENVVLEKSTDWQKDITDLLDDTDLSQYKSFKAEETGITPDDYTISCVFNLNSNSGEITVTNKSKRATSKSVTVDKVWSDGSDVHKADSIEVSLYQSTQKITDLTNLTHEKLTTAGAVQMTDTADIKYTVDLNSDNGWSYTWTGLPMDDEEKGVSEYFYYVLENMDNVEAGTDESVAGKYIASYNAETNGTKTTFTVKNTRNAIKVQKEWYDVDNELIPNEFIDEADGSVTPNEALKDLKIELKVSKKETQVPENGLNILALGDSITAGDGNGGNGYYSYLVNELKKFSIKVSDSNAQNNKKGYSQRAIRAMPDGIDYINSTGETRDGIWENIKNSDFSNYDVICLMAGTNDLISNYVNNIDGRLEWLIRNLYSSNVDGCNFKGNPNAVIFVASIPYFATSEQGTSVICSWFSASKGWDRNTYSNDKAFENYINNTIIKGYNAKIESLVKKLQSEGLEIEFVDINSVVDSWSDGCHPDDNSNNKMATKWAESINNYYTVSDTTNSKTVELDSNNNWTAVVDVDDDGEYYVTETKVTLNGEDVTDEWIASYENNGQEAESQTPVIVKNKKAPVPTTSVSIEKTWRGDSTDTSKRAGIKLELWRTATPENPDSWEYYADVDSQYSGTGNVWIYTCDNLPVKDNFGNTYSYKVVELDMDGYTVSYVNPDGVEAVENGNAGTLKLTNTRTISLKFRKIWSDSETVDHMTDKVKINVFRSTNSNDVPNGDKLPQMLKVPENVSVGVGKPESVTANKDIEIISIEPADVITASADGRTISITGNKQGTVTITVKDKSSSETATITVNVSALEMFLNGGTEFTMVAGTTGTLSAKLNNYDTDDVTFSSSDESVISVNGKTITAHKFGTADITATVGDVSVTQTITVTLPNDFAILGDNGVTIGDTLNLRIDKNYGDFEWLSSDTNVATVDQKGKVTGVSAGEVTITAKRSDGKEANKTINVQNGDIFLNDNVTITVKVGQTVTISTVGTLANNSWDFDNNKVDISINVDNSTISITGKSEGSTTGWIQGNYAPTNKSNAQFTVNVIGAFTVSPANATLAYGKSVELNPNQSVAKYEITSGSDLISISGNTVTANTGKEGTATIIATNDSGETAEIKINVVEKITTIKGTISDSTGSNGSVYSYEYDPSAGKITFIINGKNNNNHHMDVIKKDSNFKDLIPIKYEVSPSACMYGPGCAWAEWKTEFDASDNTTSIGNYDKNIGIYVNSDKSYTFTIYVKTSTNYSMRSARLKASSAVQAEAGSSDQFYYDSVEISNSSGGNWTAILDNLPVYDADGHKYYYWAVEEDVSGYTATYYFDDADNSMEYCINAEQLGSGEITIKNTKVESSSVEMPSTGGKGVKWYYVTGMAVMFVSAAGILIRRRKNPVK